MKRVKAYVIEATGLFFWLNELDNDDYVRRIGLIMHKDAITEQEAKKEAGRKAFKTFRE